MQVYKLKQGQYRYPMNETTESLVEGFYNVEHDGNQSFRWTTNKAKVRLSFYKQNQDIVVRIYKNKIPFLMIDKKSLELMIQLDESKHYITIDESNNTEAYIEIVVKNDQLSNQFTHDLIIESDVWQPSEIDTRRLGVAISKIELHR